MTMNTASYSPCERTENTSVLPYRILLVLTEKTQETYLRKYAEALAGFSLTEISVLRNYLYQDRSTIRLEPESIAEKTNEASAPPTKAETGLKTRVQEIFTLYSFDTIIAEWPEMDEEAGIFLNLAKFTGALLVLVRHRKGILRRVLLPTSGGAHSLQGLWIADALAKAWTLQAQVLRIIQPDEDFWMRRTDFKQRYRYIQKTTRFYLDVADVKMPVKVRIGGTIADDIVCHSWPGDLIVIGGSNDWLMENHTSLSIPGRVASGTRNSVILVWSQRKCPLALTDIFWDRTVRVNMYAEDKQRALEQMVDVLVDARQIPLFKREEVLTAVMQREQMGQTYMGHGTAIPHAALGGFRGLVGMFGIFPEGVPFGRNLNEKAKFIFLLITPKENYDNYLPLLARISRLMNDASKRQRLAEAVSPTQVLALLMEAEKQWQSRNEGV